MATTMAEALKNLNIQFEETEAIEMNEEQWQAQKDVEVLESYLKMCERHASEKERFRLAQEYGFVSEQHLKLWLSCNDDWRNQLEELGIYEGEKLRQKQEKAKELEGYAKNIRECDYYCMIMRWIGQKDYSPYGEDLLKRKLS